METALIIILSAAVGWFSHGKQEVTVDCQPKPLVVTECPAIQPPADDTFGATTRSYTSLVTQYRKCKAACEVK